VLQTALLFVPRKQRCPPAPATAAGVGQSDERPFGFFDVHAEPWFGLPSHTPVQGAAGVPAHAEPPTDCAQIGQGCCGLPVSTVAEFSGNVRFASPVAVLSVPVGPTPENVLVTHTERPAFEIGSGVPNLQPGAVQSMPAGVDPAAVVPTSHCEPLQVSAKRFVAPGGVALSGTCEMPPPSDSEPQRRFFSGTVPARSRNVLPHEPEPGVDRKSNPVTGGWPPVVDVVDVDVLVLVVDVVGGSVVGASEVDVDDEVLDVVGASEVDVDDEVLDVVGASEELVDVVGCSVVGAAEVDEDDVVLGVVDDDDVELGLVPEVDVLDVVGTVLDDDVDGH